jgi:glycosyltransferase involved in cell wall biosynthesis
MAAGTPVVTSNVSSLPEVAGDAALFVDPSSVSDIRTALERVISSAALRRTLSEAGRRRAELFRWERCARESIAFFEALA